MSDPTWISVLPPLLAIVLAIWTKQVYLSLEDLFAPVGTLPPELRLHFRPLGFLDPASVERTERPAPPSEPTAPVSEVDHITERFDRTTAANSPDDTMLEPSVTTIGNLAEPPSSATACGVSEPSFAP